MLTAEEIAKKVVDWNRRILPPGPSRLLSADDTDILARAYLAEHPVVGAAKEMLKHNDHATGRLLDFTSGLSDALATLEESDDT